MDDDDAVIEAARTIRPYLDRLAESPTADELDRQLANALNGRSDQSAIARRLRVLLDGQEDTAWFLAEVLADTPPCRPPYHQPRYLQRQRGILARRATRPGRRPALHLPARRLRLVPARRRRPGPGLPDPPPPR